VREFSSVYLPAASFILLQMSPPVWCQHRQAPGLKTKKIRFLGLGALQDFDGTVNFRFQPPIFNLPVISLDPSPFYQPVKKTDT
jgi:hypothetical protein